MPRLLILSNVHVEPRSSAAGRRMGQLIALFGERGWDVHYATTAGESPYALDLQSLGLKTHPLRVNDPSFDEWVAHLTPDVVMYDRFMVEEQFGWRVRKMIPNAVTVLDTEDLHCLRYARQAAVDQGRDWHEKDLFRDIAYREVASIIRTDISLMISQVEMALLQRVFGVHASQLYYTPFLEQKPDETTLSSWSGFEERNGFVSIGNFMHAPNRDAVQYLKSSIWPVIRERLPDARVDVYGAYLDPGSKRLHSPEDGFHVHGFAEDASKVMRGARVLLAPLRFGAGLKGKLIDASWEGTPSVTTSIGSEGMDAHPWPGAIADDPDHFAKEAIELYQDETHWLSARSHAAKMLAQFDREAYGLLLWRRINALLDNLQGHREARFAQQMLWHHTLKSNQYMSRWIEAKHGLS